MKKIIVFCADGTWNGPGEFDGSSSEDAPTNVYKTYISLAGRDSKDPAIFRAANEQERICVGGAGQVTQVAKYINGVGDSENYLVKLAGGIGGVGLVARIVRGYTFVSRNFQIGDRIVLAGFSRGAYTVRSLAGMIAKMGLLDGNVYDLTDRHKSYEYGARIWSEYRIRQLKSNCKLIGNLEVFLRRAPAFFTADDVPVTIPNVAIEAVAVWDTVGSYGIPSYNVNMDRLDVFEFADTNLSNMVRHGFHAVSMNEQRAEFTPTLWSDNRKSVVQVCFSGAHSDVGGGYGEKNNECGLSDIALNWMIENLKSVGVELLDEPVFRIAPNHLAPAHAPWLKIPWNVMAHKPREGLDDLRIHESVLNRRGNVVKWDPDFPPEIYK